MRLTALVGYRGAGTVEYLYSPLDSQCACTKPLSIRVWIFKSLINVKLNKLTLSMSLILFLPLWAQLWVTYLKKKRNTYFLYIILIFMYV